MTRLRQGLRRAKRSRGPWHGASQMCEALESRRLLTGLTVVTHGYEPVFSAPAWVDGLADSIATRISNFPGQVTRFDMQAVADGSGVKVLHGAATGVSPAHSTTGEVVVGLDWAAVSGIIFDARTTQEVAASVAAALLDPQFFPELGIGGALASLPIHLIGHSRGGSLVSALSRVLGQSGVWVDQVTMLDPHPLSTDEPPTAYDNVVFAEDFWQNNDSLIDGIQVAGTAGRQLTSTSTSLGHSEVHLWYAGTVDTTGQHPEGTSSLLTPFMRSDWYWPSEQLGHFAGFYWSRDGGGVEGRPSAGIGIPFGGSGMRKSFPRFGAQWPNVGDIRLPTSVLIAGQAVQIQMTFQNASVSGQAELFLDTDANPLNGVLAYINIGSVPATSSVSEGTVSGDVPDVVPGTYYIGARITDGLRSRYAYAPQIAEVQAAADHFIAAYGQAPKASDGLVDGDWIADDLKSSVSNVVTSSAYWGATNYWFQDSKGDLWALWNGGTVHESKTLPNQHEWALVNLTDAAGLSGTMHLSSGSLSGITTGWNAFSVQGIQDGRLQALWWSPEASAETYIDLDGIKKTGKALGLRGNGWQLSSVSDALTPIGGALTAVPSAFLAYSESQGNGRTEFDPRLTRYVSNGGISVVVVDVVHRVYVVTFSVSQRPIAGARPDLNGKWLIEPLAEVPSIADFGLLSQEASFEQGYVDAASA